MSRWTAADVARVIAEVSRSGAVPNTTLVPLSFVRELNPELAEAEIAAGLETVCFFEMPLRVVSALNKREHHMARARRVKKERAATAATLLAHRDEIPRVEDTPGLEVRMTRIGPRLLDSDAVGGALKGCRDETAAFLGVDDGPTSPVRWEHKQERGPWGVYRVRVEFRAPRREGR